jgi:hypothetical protein
MNESNYSGSFVLLRGNSGTDDDISPETEFAAQEDLSLPVYVGLSTTDLEPIIAAVAGFDFGG